MSELEYWAGRFWKGTISRREFLGRAGALGATALTSSLVAKIANAAEPRVRPSMLSSKCRTVTSRDFVLASPQGGYRPVLARLQIHRCPNLQTSPRPRSPWDVSGD